MNRDDWLKPIKGSQKEQDRRQLLRLFLAKVPYSLRTSHEPLALRQCIGHPFPRNIVVLAAFQPIPSPSITWLLPDQPAFHSSVHTKALAGYMSCCTVRGKKSNCTCDVFRFRNLPKGYAVVIHHISPTGGLDHLVIPVKRTKCLRSVCLSPHFFRLIKSTLNQRRVNPTRSDGINPRFAIQPDNLVFNPTNKPVLQPSLA